MQSTFGRSCFQTCVARQQPLCLPLGQGMWEEGDDPPKYYPLEVDREGVLHAFVPAAGEQQYAVIRHATAPPPEEVPLEYDEDGCVINFDKVTETSPMSFRHATATWCSCMFFICMGGLPCRHMIHILMTLQIQKYPTNQILQRWLAMSPYQVGTAVSRMLATQVPVLTSSAATPKLLRTPREDQYHALFSEFRMNRDIVLGNEVKFESMLMALQDLRTTFLEGSHDWKVPTHKARTHDEQHTASQHPSFAASSRSDGFREWPGDEKDLRETPTSIIRCIFPP